MILNKIKTHMLLSIVSVSLVLLLCGYALFNSFSKPSPPIIFDDRPNVVLIIIDVLRADMLGCYGNPENISPEIDALAQKGVLFENVIAQSSWTRPSIASMLTSLYPRQVGVYKEKYDILQDKYLTLAEILKENNYYTIGLTANPNINSVFNFHQGFDEYYDSIEVFDFMKQKQDTAKDSDTLSNTVAKLFKKVRRKFERFIRKSGQNSRSGRGAGKRIKTKSAPEIFKTVFDKITPVQKFPFYVQINVMDVHTPVIRDKYKNLFNQYAPYHKYRQATRQISFDVNDFIEKMSLLPGWGNTLFILTSDHGEGLENHKSIVLHHKHGYLLYESQLKVPLIFYNPQISAMAFKKKRVNVMVSLMDLAPTVLEYIGITPPDSFTGRSALSLMKGHDIESPQFFFAETSLRNADKASVYSKKWKFIENYDDWPGVNKYELQPAGIDEDGKFTDQIEAKGELGREMQQILHSWQKKYKKEPSVSTSREPVDKIKEQLKGLGYID